MSKTYANIFGLAPWMLAIGLFASLGISSASKAHSLLMGGASATGEGTFDGILANPALASEFATHYVSFGYAPQYKTQQIRYPGFPSNDTSGASLFSLPVGGGLYRVNSKFAVGMTIPIPGLSATVEFNELPLNILGQQANVDIIADGQILKFEGFAAFKLNPKMSLGLLAGYDSTKADVVIFDSGTKDEVAPVTVELTKIRLRVGANMRLNNKISIGLGSTLYQNESTKFEASFLKGVQDEQAEGTPEITRTLFQTVAAIAVKINSKTNVIAEMEYNPAPSENRLSLVDFTEQPIDGVMSVGGRVGAKYALTSELAFMGGGSYEPTNVGPGTTNVPEGDTTGYGFFDFNLAGITGQPAKPFWSVGGGIEFKFQRVASRKSRAANQPRSRRAPRTSRSRSAEDIGPARYKGGVKAGIVYQQTSVGIDDEGEQPAAYLQQIYHFPLTVYWNFY